MQSKLGVSSLKRIALILSVSAAISPRIALAQTCPGTLPSGMDCVASGANKDITAHSICAKITNSHSSSKAIMVPAATSTEWSEFRTKLPSGVTSSACGAGGPITLVQTVATSSGTSTSTGLTWTIAAPTIGNTVIVATSVRTGSGAISSVTGCGATFNVVASNSVNTYIYAGVCTTNGTTITASGTANVARHGYVFEVANLTGSTPTAGIPHSNGVNWTFSYTNLPTTTTANAFILIYGSGDKGMSFVTAPTNSFTPHSLADAGSGGAKIGSLAATQIVSSTGTYSTSWTAGSGGVGNMTGIGAAFY